MTAKTIVSYDDTANDRDALALGRLFMVAGAQIALAYVRHAHDDEHEHEALAEHDAQALLRRGAEALGDPDVPQHVVLSGSTGAGLGVLAERAGADIVVFGSDYRTPPGAVRPGTSAERLLSGGPAAVALAPAGLRDVELPEVRTIGLLADDHGAARMTAEALARSLGAVLAAPGERPVDLLVVGSRPETPEGRVGVSAASAYAIEIAGAPVLVVRQRRAIPFGDRVTALA